MPAIELQIFSLSGFECVKLSAMLDPSSPLSTLEGMKTAMTVLLGDIIFLWDIAFKIQVIRFYPCESVENPYETQFESRESFRASRYLRHNDCNIEASQQDCPNPRCSSGLLFLNPHTGLWIPCPVCGHDLYDMTDYGS